jgi:glycosyltransferase 2 family protein
MGAQKFKNALKLVFKVAVTALCLWYVSKKINWSETFSLLSKANIGWLIAAILLFVLSKIVSSFRLNYFFKSIDVHLSERKNLKLYWLGMFYNLFLPGGIGGDAYKVILLNRRNKHSVKSLSAAVLLDRISGVAGLGILAAVYFFIIQKNTYSSLIFAAVIPGVIAFYFFVKILFRSFTKVFTSTLLLGIFVQVLQVLCVYCIMASIGIPFETHPYILIFLLSSIVAILPFTIGGLGAREVVFLWGSKQFGLDIHQAVYISILFYLITLLISAVGLLWVFDDPLKNSYSIQD